MGRFDGIFEAKAVGGGGNYIKPGSYLLSLSRVAAERRKDSQGMEGDFFFVEAEVVESRQTDTNIAPQPPGSSITVLALNTTKYGFLKAHIKAFILALVGVSEAEITRQEFDDVMADLLEKEKGTGLRIRAEAHEEPKKKGGGLVTKVKFVHVPKEKQAA